MFPQAPAALPEQVAFQLQMFDPFLTGFVRALTALCGALRRSFEISIVEVTKLVSDSLLLLTGTLLLVMGAAKNPIQNCCGGLIIA